MKLKEITKTWLKENGYDGLCDTDTECGCLVEDLMPCGEPSIHCEAGHQEPVPKDSGVDDIFKPDASQPSVEDGRATHCDCRGRFVPLSVGIRCEWCGKEPSAA